jgi:hypothetical protein
MTGFDEREKGFERKFQRDQEFDFKVRSRGRKLLGLWAAGRLGLAGAAAEIYASELAALGLHRGGDREEAEHIARDLAARGVTVDVEHVMLEAERCEREARQQLGAVG